MPSDIVLRDVAESDLPILFEQQRDPDAARMAAFPSRDRLAFMTHWRKLLHDDDVKRNSTVRVILCDGQVAGHIACFPLSGETLVGYWLGREYWGKGVATRALAAFLQVVAARPLRARVAKHNIASLRVLQKCGFMICGEDTFPDEHGALIEEFVLCLAESANTQATGAA